MGYDEYEPGVFRLFRWVFWALLPAILLRGLAVHFPAFWAAHSAALGTTFIPGVGSVPVADFMAQPVHTFSTIFREQIQAALGRFPTTVP